MEASQSFEKNLSSKVEKIREEKNKLKNQISQLRAELRAERKKNKDLRKSRDTWKKKHKLKTQENKRLWNKLERASKAKRHHFDLSIVFLCILLRVKAGCSFRGVRRVLEILKQQEIIKVEKLPCANSVQNWVAKMGLSCLKEEEINPDKQLEEVCLIMDENLKTGNERVMLFLTSPPTKLKEGFFTYQDVDVMHIEGKKSWTGEKISNCIKEQAAKKGLKITHILSDQDSKLLKATRLFGVEHLADINHVVAKCLRTVFKENEAYKKMMKLIGGYASKSVNQVLTYLRPQNQRKKARFMNQKPVIQWGLDILSKFGTLNEKEQAFFVELKNHKSMLTQIKKCIDLGEIIKKHLAENGLSKTSLQLAKQSVELIKGKKMDNTLVSFTKLIEKELDKYEEFLLKKDRETPKKDKDEDKETIYNVSSVIIESLIGKLKNLTSTNALVGLSLVDLELPLHCLQDNQLKNNLHHGLERIFMHNLKTWKKDYSIESQAVKRNKFFKKRA